MYPSRSNHLASSPSRSGLLHIAAALLFALLAPALAAAQDIKLGATYICNGEHIWVDSCNIRDLSDNGTCMVEHPDHTNAGGIAAITSETRGSLKKRLPTCQQPTWEWSRTNPRAPAASSLSRARSGDSTGSASGPSTFSAAMSTSVFPKLRTRR